MKAMPVFVVAAVTAFSGFAMADEPAALGYWVTPQGGSVVQIQQCGATLCGQIVGLRTTRRPDESPSDIHNPDKAKRDQPLCGLTMMGDLAPAKGSATEWEGGWVYDPDSGDTYKAQMKLDGPDKLDLRGYVGISLFGRTMSWTRETGENKNRCTPPKSG
jgi:uncharacterized protein (DUF2147 family)